MCRHFAYLGEQVSIKELLLDPPHGLVEQAWRPRRQRHGTMNVDGFGIGWFADGDPAPARYRRTGPIWADDFVPDLARVTRTSAMLGAVRSASVGTDAGASAAAPYTDGRWLFSLNGALVGWSAAAGGPTKGRRKTTSAPAFGQESGLLAEPAGAEPVTEPALAAAQARAEAAGESITEPTPIAPPGSLTDAAAAVLRLTDRIPAADLLGLHARCDTALLWTMVQLRLRAGEGPTEALAGTIADVTEAGVTGRFNLLLTDGKVIAATAAGDTLCYRRDRSGVVIASEPFDDDPAWQDVPDGSVVEATPAAAVVRPLLLTSPQADRFALAGTPNGAGHGTAHHNQEASSR